MERQLPDPRGLHASSVSSGTAHSGADGRDDESRNRRELVLIENELQGAIAAGQLHLRYQPQVDGASGRLIGAEALLRWRHDRLGWIAPSVFIPIAERNGTMTTLGSWVMQTAIEQIAAWDRVGRVRVPISVNVSAQEIVQPDFFRATTDLLAACSVRPERLKIELTETSVIEDLRAAAMSLEALRDAGIAAAIDDFGTGNASLSLLASLPLSILKIDKSFVDGLAGDHRARRVVDATLGLARAFDMEVVAEGVANAAQVEWLLGRGCTAMQGDHFGRPARSEELVRQWLPSGERRPDDADPGLSLS